MKPYINLKTFSYHENNKVAEKFQTLIDIRKEFGMQIFLHHKILVNLNGILDMFATNHPLDEISETYEIGTEKNFSYLFKYATGHTLTQALKYMEAK